ncbi:Retrovirus-related Pol polyprotein from transposon gypsy [Trichinella murrelli]|uniref:Retrovirus-related Pol polyprotein from transposon gypsy n=1 Tax=Trichinella murrelli TaxID=144512 RepID=A0A0V0T3J8_9BILA|nr:Retrovirus-related Pol polyprotein from transposon gypsy [Trichinella murrelli]
MNFSRCWDILKTFVTTRWARSSGSLPPGPLQYARHHSWPAPLRSHGLVFVLSSSTFVSSHHSHSTLVHLLTDWMVSTAPIYRTILPQGGTGVGQLKFDPSIVLLTIPGLRPFYKSAASYAAALIRSTNGISLTGDDRTTEESAVLAGGRGGFTAAALRLPQLDLQLAAPPYSNGCHTLFKKKSIATEQNKTSAVQEWSTPICVTELRQFLGLASYYRKFINGFANIAAPLHRMLEKGTEWDIAAD